jgi:hypothetical protein
LRVGWLSIAARSATGGNGSWNGGSKAKRSWSVCRITRVRGVRRLAELVFDDPILTIADLLRGAEVKMPPTGVTFEQAPKAAPTESGQAELGFQA